MEVDGRPDEIGAIARLADSARYQETLARVEAEVAARGDAMPAAWLGPSEDDPTYRLIVACNELVVAIDNEVHTVHSYLKDK